MLIVMLSLKNVKLGVKIEEKEHSQVAENDIEKIRA